MPIAARRRITATAVFSATLLVVVGVVAPAPRPARPEVSARLLTLAAGEVSPGWSTTVQPGIAANLLAARWDGAAGGAVAVRVRTNGVWGGWLSLDGSPSEGPDSSSPEHRPVTSAGPVWVGDGTHTVEVRVVEGNLRGLRLAAIRSQSTTGSSYGLAAASAEPAAPGIITRAQWGADESWRNLTPDCDGSPFYAPTVRYAIVHHTDTTNNYTPDQAAAIVRGIYYFHTHTNGWCDIGYNFLVDRFGNVYEGRYGGITKAVIGAHAGGFNAGSTGVALLGEFQDAAVPSAMYAGLERLLAWKLGYHGVDAEAHITVVSADFSGSRYPTGTPVDVATIIGHRDVDLTGCPGDIGYTILASLRAAVQRDVMNSPPYPFGGWNPAASGPKILTLDAHGGLHPAGAQPAVTHGAYWPTWSIARGAVRAATGGYVLDGWGGLHPFGGAPAVSGTAYWPGWDIARGIASGPLADSGWVLDGWGGLHPFGGAPPVPASAYWPGWDIARGIATPATRAGGYVLDGWGGLHPFGAAVPVAASAYWRGWDIARGVALRSDGRSGYVLDGWGGLHPFGGAPAVASSGYFPGHDVMRGLVLTASGNGGWTIDADGHLYAFGDAPAVQPSLTWTGLALGRAVVALPYTPPPPSSTTTTSTTRP